jgi:hypothetical protein
VTFESVHTVTLDTILSRLNQSTPLHWTKYWAVWISPQHYNWHYIEPFESVNSTTIDTILSCLNQSTALQLTLYWAIWISPHPHTIFLLLYYAIAYDLFKNGVNNVLENMWKVATVALRYYPRICLEGPSKTTIILRQVHWCLTVIRTEYTSEALPLEPTCLVYFNIILQSTPISYERIFISSFPIMFLCIFKPPAPFTRPHSPPISFPSI